MIMLIMVLIQIPLDIYIYPITTLFFPLLGEWQIGKGTY